MVLHVGLISIEGQFPVQEASWDARYYEAKVDQLFRYTRHSPCWVAVLAHIRRDVLIIPTLTDDPGETETRRFPPEDAYRLGEVIRACRDDPNTAMDERGTIIEPDFRGTGRGAALTVIQFRPDVWRSPARPVARGGRFASFAADDVLFHELIHAAMNTAGTASCSPALYNMRNWDEYWAVTIANMYLRERRRPARDGYGDVLPMLGQQSWRRPVWCYQAQGQGSPGSGSSRSEYDADMVARFVQENRSLTAALRSIPRSVSDYNPFLDHPSAS